MSSVRHLLQQLLAGPAVALPTDPIPAPWLGILEARVPISRQLDDADRDRLLHLAQLFLRDVPMEGCGGLELTDEIRVTIAATASLLLLKLAYPRYQRLRRILVYPDTFVPTRVAAVHGHAMQDIPSPELGEAWPDGIIVLSWSSIIAGAGAAGEHNVILHEFAHMLDFEDAVADGRPVLDSKPAELTWATTFAAEFARLQAAADAGAETVLDPYGSTNRAEFFAVATEAFFGSGRHLRKHLPALYEQMRAFYRQDPASRSLD